MFPDGMNAKDWLQIATYVATVIAALTGMGTAIFIAYQLTLMKRAREVDTFLRMIDSGNSDLVRTAANWLKHEMNPLMTYEEAMQPGNRDKIAVVVHHFEMIGILVDHGYINGKLVYDQMGPWVVGSWGKLQEFITTHRARKRAPDYAENFELLVTGYHAWSQKNPAKLEKRGRASHDALQDYYKGGNRHALPPNE